MKPYVKKVKRKIKKPLTRREVKTNRAKTDKAFLGFLEEKKKKAKPLSPGKFALQPSAWLKLVSTKDEPALDITVDTGPVNYDNDWKQFEDRQPARGNGNIIVAMVVLCFVFVVGLVIGSFIGGSSPQYRDRIEYVRPMELNGIVENPWGPRKIPLLPEDVEILEGR